MSLARGPRDRDQPRPSSVPPTSRAPTLTKLATKILHFPNVFLKKKEKEKKKGTYKTFLMNFFLNVDAFAIVHEFLKTKITLNFLVLFVLEACCGVKLQPAMRELPEADEATRGRGRGHHGDDGLAREAARGGSRTTVARRRALAGPLRARRGVAALRTYRVAKRTARPTWRNSH